VTTIRNGVDVDRFRPIDIDQEMSRMLGFDPDATNLFFLSVLDEYHEYKGLENLLKAMQILSSSFHLVIGGDGSKREYYERICSKIGVDNQVRFAGYIPDRDLPNYYNAADVSVLPSTSSEQEGFGLVLLESLACGTPVVTTEVVGVADEVNREDLGVVIPESEPEQIASSVSAAASGDVRLLRVIQESGSSIGT
jgi:glycosyltransferase involved in cell wall biosynthesis